MTESEPQWIFLRDPRLATHALSSAPVWLWSADGERILWANSTGASIFDAASPMAAAATRFGPRHTAAAQISRLAATLPQGNSPRLERLRGFGARFGGMLVCLCSRITLADNTTAILVISTERAGDDIALPERARRLLADVQQPAAIFTADGELMEAQPAGTALIGNRRDLIALGAEKLAREASLNGTAEGETLAGHASLFKLGAGPTFGLLVVFSGHATTSDTEHASPKAATTPAVPSPPTLEVRPQYAPVRFVWQTDSGARFTLASLEFADLLGPKTATLLGHAWNDIARTLNLDPQDQIASALTARETFSGIVLFWPLDDFDERLAVEMSGLPVFDRDRKFKGFRGFGICRDFTRLEQIRQRRGGKAVPPPASREAKTKKIVPFPATPEPQTQEQKFNVRDRSAFQELARELSERLKKSSGKGNKPPPDDLVAGPPVQGPPVREPAKAVQNAQDSRAIFDRLPIGILVYRLNNLIYANRVFLEWTGYATLDALNEAGGLDSLFIDSKDKSTSKDGGNGAKTLTIATINGTQKPVEGRLFSAMWNGENALVLMIDPRVGTNEKPIGISPDSVTRENRELKAILDTATDGVLMLDRTGRIIFANRSAEALFGYESADFTEHSFGDLLAPESRRLALDHLDRLAHSSGAGVLDAGYDAIGRVRQGGLVPLHITMGRIEGGEKLCVVLREVTAWKHTAEELTDAKQAAEKASIAKSEFVAKISHEIRTPLNAIIGFSEVMMDERFGPIGNERYRQYLKDIHASGGHLISLLNDLVDLSKIEAGKLDLTFVSVSLNDLTQQCVAIMQQQASREHVIVRTSLSANLPQIVADARSVRQIALNLLSNSIKFTGAGGQVIVSTALTDDQEVVLRVRDTGTGMSEKDLETALEPFRQVATVAHWGSSGTGLGLPIIKALVEANHARFRIASEVGSGTLVEVSFPTTRVLAQ
ncbi:MAG TPA: PAS domain-containing protein [Pseudolabrys sp.]|nr:PAS domain-containing protein [Pseudolabrys sp.]